MDKSKLRDIVQEKAKANGMKFKASAVDEIIDMAGKMIWYHYHWRTRYSTDTISISDGDYRVALPDDFYNWESGYIYSSSNIGYEFKVIDANKYNELFRNQSNQGEGIPTYGKFMYDKKLYLYLSRPADSSYTLVVNYYSAFKGIQELPSSCDQALITAIAYSIARDGSEEAARIRNQLYGVDLPNAVEGDQLDQSSPTNLRQDDFTGTMPFHLDR